jgi:ribosomal 30S subunit maturation factor RimM
LKFLFVFSHVLLVIKQKKNEIVKYIITSSNQTKKKTTIIFVKIRNRETGKRLRELEVIVSVKAREVKKERERRKNIIYTKNSSYLHWVIRVGSS